MPMNTTTDPIAPKHMANENAASELEVSPLGGSGHPDRMELSSFGKRYQLYLQRKESRSEYEKDKTSRP